MKRTHWIPIGFTVLCFALGFDIGAAEGSWGNAIPPRGGGGGSGTISAGTANQSVKYTDATTVGPGACSDDASSFVCTEPITSSQAVALTSTDGMRLWTTATATVGAQKMSPGVNFKGSGWKTDATAAAQAVNAVVELLPVQGTSAPTSKLNTSFGVNGGAATVRQTLTSGGQLLLGDGLVGAPSFSFIASPTTGIYSSAADRITFAAAGASKFYVDSSGTPVTFIALANFEQNITNGNGNNPTCGGINAGAVCSTTGLGSTGAVNGTKFLSNTNCLDNAGAAACSAASAGHFVLDAASSTVTVSTTAVTASSEVRVFEEPWSGTLHGSITCNSDHLVLPFVTTVTAATSFVVTSYAIATGSVLAPATNPLCLGYVIEN